MTTIKADDIFNAATLLEQRQTAMDALDMLGKPGFITAIFVSNEDNNDSYDVSLNYSIAQAALKNQIKQIDADLAKLDLAVA